MNHWRGVSEAAKALLEAGAKARETEDGRSAFRYTAAVCIEQVARATLDLVSAIRESDVKNRGERRKLVAALLSGAAGVIK